MYNVHIILIIYIRKYTYTFNIISITSDMQMTPPLWQKVRRTKEPLDGSERGE